MILQTKNVISILDLAWFSWENVNLLEIASFHKLPISKICEFPNHENQRFPLLWDLSFWDSSKFEDGGKVNSNF